MQNMRALFDDVDTGSRIPGLSYLANYIDAVEESRLVSAIDKEAWNTTWKRRRQPYGESYGKVAARSPIPAWAHGLRDRLFAEGIGGRPFDQMLVNEYLPGQGIAMHRDYSPFDRTVVSFSLLSSCTMEFRHVESGERESMLLEPRSLLVLSDEARYEWQHGIAARKSDRWHGTVIPRGRRLSVTFRLLKRDAVSSPR
jgi:alkylated DNA repair dioxygenase AlkB